MRTVSAAEANRHFSKLLRAVAAGEKVVVTSRGKPVATIEAFNSSDGKAEADHRQQEWREFLAELRRRPAQNLGRFNRDDAYE